MLYAGEFVKITNVAANSNTKNFYNAKLRSKIKDKNFKYAETKQIKTDSDTCNFIDNSTMYIRLPIDNNKKIYDNIKIKYEKKLKDDSVQISDYLDVQDARENTHLKVGFENNNQDYVIEATYKTQGKSLETYQKTSESEILVISHNKNSSLSVFF